MGRYTCLTLCCAISISLFQGIANVQRPYYMMSEYSRSRVAMEEDREPPRKEPHGGTVRKVYVTNSHKMPVREPAHPVNPMTASKCCKMGEKVAKEGMHCIFEVHTAPTMLNNANSAKLRLYRQHALKTAGIERSSNYKNLVSKLARCEPFVSKFEKCCNYRASFMKSMKRCRDLKGHERRQCRNKTRKSFGYTHK